MADARTPKTPTVLHVWLKGHPFPLTTDLAEREAEFWRWLAAHDRETAARAWGEGFVAGVNADMGDYEHPPDIVTNPYREGGPT